jgi:hypothetical protein
MKSKNHTIEKQKEDRFDISIGSLAEGFCLLSSRLNLSSLKLNLIKWMI